MSSPVISGTTTIECVDGGDAAELQARVRAALAANAALYVADAALAGVGDGPRWLAELTFTTNAASGLSVAGLTSAYCVRGGNPAELKQRIAAVLALDTGPYVCIEVAGGGTGRDYMALILLNIALGP